ncbi:MAG: isopentenyl pyrophosphate isomerase, partial [Moorea sp. SIO3G5]|nr:isopentenyl pyrophosphate isomerase [Moorena sp. SIO3G5]
MGRVGGVGRWGDGEMGRWGVLTGVGFLHLGRESGIGNRESGVVR